MFKPTVTIHLWIEAKRFLHHIRNWEIKNSYLKKERKKKSKDHFKPHGQKNLMKDSNSKNKTKIDMQLF